MPWKLTTDTEFYQKLEEGTPILMYKNGFLAHSPTLRTKYGLATYKPYLEQHDIYFVYTMLLTIEQFKHAVDRADVTTSRFTTMLNSNKVCTL